MSDTPPWERSNTDRVHFRATFDDDADAYDRTPARVPGRVFDDIVELAGLGPTSHVLEIGPGTGQATRPLAERKSGHRGRTRTGPGRPGRGQRGGIREGEGAQLILRGVRTGRSVLRTVFACNSFHWIDPDVRYARPPTAAPRRASGRPFDAMGRARRRRPILVGRAGRLGGGTAAATTRQPSTPIVSTFRLTGLAESGLFADAIIRRTRSTSSSRPRTTSRTFAPSPATRSWRAPRSARLPIASGGASTSGAGASGPTCSPSSPWRSAGRDDRRASSRQTRPSEASGRTDRPPPAPPARRPGVHPSRRAAWCSSRPRPRIAMTPCGATRRRFDRPASPSPTHRACCSRSDRARAAASARLSARMTLEEVVSGFAAVHRGPSGRGTRRPRVALRARAQPGEASGPPLASADGAVRARRRPPSLSSPMRIGKRWIAPATRPTASLASPTGRKTKRFASSTPRASKPRTSRSRAPACCSRGLTPPTSLARVNDIAAELIGRHSGEVRSVRRAAASGRRREPGRARPLRSTSSKLDGIGLMTHHGDVYLGDPRLDEVFDELNRRAATVFIHPTTPLCCGDAFLDIPTARARVHLRHRASGDEPHPLGNARPMPRRQLDHPARRRTRSLHSASDSMQCTRSRRVVPALSSHPPRISTGFDYDLAGPRPDSALQALLGITDESRLLYGSDWPFTPEPGVARMLSDLRETTVLERPVDELLNANARRLLPGQFGLRGA